MLPTELIRQWYCKQLWLGFEAGQQARTGACMGEQTVSETLGAGTLCQKLPNIASPKNRRIIGI